MPEPTTVDIRQLPQHVDISCVQAFHTRADLAALAEVATERGFVSAHVLPHWVPVMRELLAGSTTLVGAPVGFPAGGNATATKVFEARSLLDAGVQELDVVVNVGRLRSGEVDFVRDELAQIVALVAGRLPLRAILEVGHLDDDQIRLGCRAAVEAGVPWVKSGTGWSGVPTSVHHVEVMAQAVAGAAELKAAGGVRDLATVRAMVALGVTRFGMNAAVAAELAAEAAQDPSVAGEASRA
ncbi:deoxyribose-phosphate aldolase [Nocardioides sp. SYSU D00065]|uniref:deoxyribose-phosphate aldolase n=1 Tax=Nocardioides sp. SYSU D00065 TaxID=2817378 RepID=UPI001B31A0D3|nr:deoxyribose-phosphate aldolase [Nocardioides sp. SYSU D00065]